MRWFFTLTTATLFMVAPSLAAPLVQSVRVGDYPAKTRFVLDLTEPVRFNVRPADAIVCFTDGLPDSLGGPDRQRFGLPRVLSTLARSRRRDPLPMLRRSIESFADPRAEQDDVTVLWAGDVRRRAA